MSERGSFVTEYIYCKECFEAAKRVLLKDGKLLRGVMVSSWTGSYDPHLPIIAGKVGGLYSGEELDVFEQELVQELSASICHELRIAVLAEVGERIFVVTPNALS